MKKAYSKPFLEVEVYQLDAALAAGCNYIVNMGPGTWDGKYEACTDYPEDDWIVNSKPGTSIMSSLNSPFYDEDNYCDCYYTSGGIAYIAS